MKGSGWLSLIRASSVANGLRILANRLTLATRNAAANCRRLIAGGALPVASKSPEKFASFIGAKETGATAEQYSDHSPRPPIGVVLPRARHEGVNPWSHFHPVGLANRLPQFGASGRSAAL